uniref:Rab3 GTPase-activating protein catalytic subunit n=1 Tax=Macrostomum lignano TaxID=282301 RepID=A0A1I8FH97_9PLAT
ERALPPPERLRKLSADQIELFQQKLQQCRVVFDFSDPVSDLKSKEGVLQDSTYPEIYEAHECQIACNIFRIMLPPIDNAEFDPDEDDPTLERFLAASSVARDFQPSVRWLKSYIDQQPLSNIFDSRSILESADFLKTGWAASINGFALPLKAEHKQFLMKSAACRCHQGPVSRMFHAQLALLLYRWCWGCSSSGPGTVSSKEVMYLAKIEEILDTPLVIEAAHERCSIWNNEYIASLVEEHNEVLMPILFQRSTGFRESTGTKTIVAMVYNRAKREKDRDDLLRKFDDIRRLKNSVRDEASRGGGGPTAGSYPIPRMTRSEQSRHGMTGGKHCSRQSNVARSDVQAGPIDGPTSTG